MENATNGQMSADRELLELAAKAAFNKRAVWHEDFDGEALQPGESVQLIGGRWWNPITDNGDALRLAVALKIDLHFPGDCDFMEAWPVGMESLKDAVQEGLGADHAAATRRAIVRAAAEIGRRKQTLNIINPAHSVLTEIGFGLDAIGALRSVELPRKHNESDDDYRRRLIQKFRGCYDGNALIYS